MSGYFKGLKAKIQYSDYYNSWNTEVIKLLKKIKRDKGDIVTWGAGMKGICCLEYIDSKNEYISYVIDMNIQLHGKKMPTGQKIVGREILQTKKIAAVLVMNDVYFVDIFFTLRKNGYEGQIIDLDKMIKGKLSTQEVLEDSSENDLMENEKFDCTMREIQIKALEVLEEVNRVCKEHHITYFLEAGSALGAERYSKMIPCDDDIDIAMLRDDYEQFIKIAPKSLNDGYILQTLNSKNDYPYMYAQVMADNTCFVRDRQKMLRMHHGIHIDIAPLDYVSENIIERKKQKNKIEKYKLLIRKKKIPENYIGKNLIKKLIVNWDYYSLKFVSIKYLEKKALDAFKMYNEKSTKWVGDLCTHYKKDISFPYEMLYPVKEHLFEGKEYPVPNNIDYYLKVMYDDYKMLSPRETGGTKYELFKVSLIENYIYDTK